MERVAFKSNSFEQADKWDVKQHINLTVEERLKIARGSARDPGPSVWHIGIDRLGSETRPDQIYRILKKNLY